MSKSRALKSWSLPSKMWMKLDIEPRKSSSVRNLIAALIDQNGAQQNGVGHRSIIVASGARTMFASRSAEPA